MDLRPDEPRQELELVRPDAPAPARLDTHPVAVYLAQLAGSSRVTVRKDLRTIARILGQPDARRCPWHEVRYAHVAAIRSKLAEHYAPATANRMLSSLRGVLRQCCRLGQMCWEDYQGCQVKPIRGASLPAGRALSHAEIEALMNACRDAGGAAGARDAAIIAVLCRSGLRRSEASSLDLASWEQPPKGETSTGGGLRVMGKGHKERLAPVPPDGAAVLRRWIRYRGKTPGPLLCPVYGNTVKADRRLTAEALYAVLQRRAEEAGVEHLGCHDLRRTLATDLLDRGNDLGVVAGILGHSKLDTTRRYDLRPQAARHRAVDALQLPGAEGWASDEQDAE